MPQKMMMDISKIPPFWLKNSLKASQKCWADKKRFYFSPPKKGWKCGLIQWFNNCCCPPSCWGPLFRVQTVQGRPKSGLSLADPANSYPIWLFSSEKKTRFQVQLSCPSILIAFRNRLAKKGYFNRVHSQIYKNPFSLYFVSPGLTLRWPPRLLPIFSSLAL